MTKIGTLKELGVQPGDVVGCVELCKVFLFSVGREYNVVNGFRGVPSCNGVPIDSSCTAKFRLISRATTAPKLWREMTPEEKGALLLAAHEGKVIEYQDKRGKWLTKNPQWWSDFAYRIKPTRTKSEWSAWFTIKADGTTKLNLSECADVERVALGDSNQFAYRVKKWVE